VGAAEDAIDRAVPTEFLNPSVKSNFLKSKEIFVYCEKTDPDVKKSKHLVSKIFYKIYCE